MKNIKKYFLEDLCPGVDMVRIGKWYIKEGDSIEQETKVADFESTKVNFEVYAPVSGKVTQIHCLPGVEVNGDIPLISIEVT